MSDKHLSSQFDADLNLLCAKVLEMGHFVEMQIVTAMRSLNDLNPEAAAQVIRNEQQLNAMEIEIDQACCYTIARRQPAARDLRLLMAISKMIPNLERAGDEAEKIATRTQRIIANGARMINYSEIKLAGEMAVTILRRALEAFAQFDAFAAAQIVRDDRALDEEFRAFVRKLITYMMEDPRTISVGLDYLSIAKAIERIGDHATNLAEFIIYIVKGTDVRHVPPDQLEREVLT
ncbi:phosphate signaling complex protein PhoU [Mycoavidus sp. B2-EB]|uniref:phosphate signaling complex protein PhoU n=1 Tax=Mycoavidus sp. B2-EB TaxID=2651972 RepID=UPI0016277EEA|nr:phosphate signaling complex protein PhoU [Mycoavidus sp. B2-EB]BBO60296.1 phosphate-specific transport system accessory protein PhoU [Mycoavidus sp. B2-EB]